MFIFDNFESKRDRPLITLIVFNRTTHTNAHTTHTNTYFVFYALNLCHLKLNIDLM